MLSSFLLLTVVDGGAGPGSRRTTALHWQRPSGGSEGMARTLGVGATGSLRAWIKTEGERRGGRG